MMVLGFHSERHRDTPVDLFATEPFDFNAEYATALVEEVAPGGRYGSCGWRPCSG